MAESQIDVTKSDIQDTRACEGNITIEYVRVDDVVKYQRNSRTHSAAQVEQIKKSIQEFGFTNPVIFDENNVLIAGHGRIEAATQLKLEKVPGIRLVGLSEVQKKALRIADNKLPLNAGWDEEQLKLEIIDLQAEDFHLDLLGFTPDELEFYTQDIDIDGFFEEVESEAEAKEEEEPKKIKCPHCGEMIEVD
jgi:ParB-like chromosome segregation protein Spo0J